MILSLANFLTCLLAGFVIFAYIGNLSNLVGLPIEKVATEGKTCLQEFSLIKSEYYLKKKGAGLIYVVLPFAVTNLPFPPIWSILLFVMMIMLGMGTMVSSFLI